MSDNLIQLFQPSDDRPARRPPSRRCTTAWSSSASARGSLDVDVPHRRLPRRPAAARGAPRTGSSASPSRREDHDARASDLARDRIGSRILRGDKRLDDAGSRARRVLRRSTRTASTSPLDLRLAHGFRLDVLAPPAARSPTGRTESYAEVAAAAGNPRAVRAVGTACATNPVPIVVPCHRVVRRTAAAWAATSGGLTPSVSCSTSSRPPDRFDLRPVPRYSVSRLRPSRLWRARRYLDRRYLEPGDATVRASGPCLTRVRHWAHLDRPDRGADETQGRGGVPHVRARSGRRCCADARSCSAATGPTATSSSRRRSPGLRRLASHRHGRRGGLHATHHDEPLPQRPAQTQARGAHRRDARAGRDRPRPRARDDPDRAARDLPEKQRAVIVLRFWEDLTVPADRRVHRAWPRAPSRARSPGPSPPCATGSPNHP